MMLYGFVLLVGEQATGTRHQNVRPGEATAPGGTYSVAGSELRLFAERAFHRRHHTGGSSMPLALCL